MSNRQLPIWLPMPAWLLEMDAEHIAELKIEYARQILAAFREVVVAVITGAVEGDACGSNQADTSAQGDMSGQVCR